MSELNPTQLRQILDQHALWRRDQLKGVRASLRRADLSNADLSNANLVWSNLPEANLHGADLHGADLSVAILRGADLTGANLRGVNLRVVDLRDANLRGADLRDANLRGADLRGADLHEANLHNADLCDARLHSADLCDANLNDANLPDADLQEAKRGRAVIGPGRILTFVTDYPGESFRDTSGTRWLEYGCETHTLAGWREHVEALCHKHDPKNVAARKREILALVDLCDALDAGRAGLEPAHQGSTAELPACGEQVNTTNREEQ